MKSRSIGKERVNRASVYLDIRLYLCYTILYEKAEQTASYMGIPRSQLFAMALEEFISRHNGSMVTEKINEVYEKIDQAEFEPYLTVGLEPIRKITKNDTW